MSLNILKISCQKVDFVEEHECEFVIDLSTRDIYEYDYYIDEDIHLLDPVAIYLEPISQDLSLLFEDGELQFLNEKFRQSLLKNVLEEFSVKSFGQYVRSTTEYAIELFGVFDIEYKQVNNFADPIEYDAVVSYKGILFKDLEISKKE